MTISLILLPFCAPLLALGSQVVSVSSYGAVGNGTHATQNRAAFLQAFAAAGTEGLVIVPPGSYALDNGAGPLTISDFDGEFRFEGNSRLVFTNENASGVAFSRGWGLTVSGFHSFYSSNSSLVSNTAALSFSGTINLRLSNAIVQGSPGAGIMVSNALEAKIHDAVVSGTRGAGILMTNSRNSDIANATVNGSYSDGFVFHTESGVTGHDGAIASNLTVVSSPRGIVVSGASNVLISGFRVDNASDAGLFCGEENSALPSNVSFRAGLVSSPGSTGVEVSNASSCSFSDIEIYNVLGHALSATAPQGSVTVEGVHAIGVTSSDAFDFTNVQQVNVSSSSAEDVDGSGFLFDTVQAAQVSGITTTDVSRANPSHHAIWFQNSTLFTATNLVIVDDQSTATGYVLGASNIRHGNIQNVSSAINQRSLSLQLPTSVTATQIY